VSGGNGDIFPELVSDIVRETWADAGCETICDSVDLADLLDLGFDPDSGVDVSGAQEWRLELLTTIGSGQVGTAPGEFNYPSGIDVDSEDNLYVLDLSNSRIQKFDRQGVFLTEWPHETFGYVEGGANQGLAVDAANNIYAISPHTHVIRKYGPNGDALLSFELIEHDIWGTDLNMSAHPHGLSFGPFGLLYITEATLGQIQIYTSEGAYVDTWEFPIIQGNAPTPPPLWAQVPYWVAVHPNGDVYVADGYWIRQLDTTGELIKTWSNAAPALLTNPPAVSGAFWFAFQGLHVSETGLLIVCETAPGETARLVAYEPDGSLAWIWGGAMSLNYGSTILPSPEEFITTTDVTVDSEGAVWVSDAWGHYVRRFGIIYNGL